MGGVGSKRKEFFDALRANPEGPSFYSAKTALKDADDTFAIGTIIEEETKMNTLMIAISSLSEKVDIHAEVFNFARNHVKEYDLKYVNPMTGFTIMHYLGAVHAGDYEAYTAPDLPANATAKERKLFFKKYLPTPRQKLHLILGDLAELFLAEGADLDVRDKNGRTPLMHAAGNQQVLVVRELCGAGADVNFLSAAGDSPLLSAIRGGSVDCVSQILALCKNEVKFNAYYDNKGAAYDQSERTGGSSSPAIERRIAERPLAAALKGRRKDVFEFLIKNNFELSEWYHLKILTPEQDKQLLVTDPKEAQKKKKLENDARREGRFILEDYDKFFKNTLRVDDKFSVALQFAAPKQEDIGHDFDGLELLQACAGNSLAQSVLLRSFGAFEILVEQYDPRLPFAKFPNNASILHAIASFKVDTREKSDSAIDFVDAVREKCVKYSADGQYDWNVKDDQGQTPLDYCELVNDSTMLIGPRSSTPRQLHSVSKPFTALIFIETLKFYPDDGEQIELAISDPSSLEVFDVLSVAPDNLLNKVTRISLQRCACDDMKLSNFVNMFPNLEELVMDDLDEVKDILDRILGHYGTKRAKQAASKKQAKDDADKIEIDPTADYNQTKLKMISISGCQKLSKDKVNFFQRDGLEIKWNKREE